MKILNYFVTQFITLAFIFAGIKSVEAQTPYLSAEQVFTTVSFRQVRGRAIKLYIYSGRTSVIDFSETNEVIISIKVGDSSRTVFSTNLPLDTGQARTIFVGAIQPLNISRATTNSITNLVVKTLDSLTQKQRLYLFDIYHQGQTKPANNGIRIVNQNSSEPTELTWKVEGRLVNLFDIETGLRVAIQKGFTSANDPVVLKVREFLAIANNLQVSLPEAAKRASLELAVVSELAKIGLEERLAKFQPSNSTFDNVHSSGETVNVR